MTTVFDAFPKAIVRNKWVLGKIQRATEVGDVFSDATPLDVIEDDARTLDYGSTSTPDFLSDQTLLYLRPSNLPTLDAAALISQYALQDSTTGRFYKIASSSIGKNQNTGAIEHVEVTLVESEATIDG